MRLRKVLLLSVLLLLFSCEKENTDVIVESSITDKGDSETKVSETIDVKFELGESEEYDGVIKEDASVLKSLDRIHSVKYYTYMPSPESTLGNFIYYDAIGNKRIMTIDDKAKPNTFEWKDNENVLTKNPPIGHKMSYGIDISKHNGDVDFIKVKDAGFDFVFVRIAYRGYGRQGKLVVDEMQSQNLKLARNAGLKVGAYVFSQAVTEDEAIEEARLAVELVKDYGLDLPIAFDPETIRNEIARTDNIEGEQFTNNAIAFCEEIKKLGFTPAIYSNMVWEDYYFDMEKLKDYEIWYADYNKIPQTPYEFKYWQFSDVGLVDGVDGHVDLNVMIE